MMLTDQTQRSSGDRRFVQTLVNGEIGHGKVTGVPRDRSIFVNEYQILRLDENK